MPRRRITTIESTHTADNVYEDIMKQAAQIIEKIAREIVPQVAERVIKEEIEKLKKISATK